MISKYKILFGLGLFLLGTEIAQAQTCPSYTYTFTNGSTADATQVNGNFSTIMNCVNNSIVGVTTVSGGNVGVGTTTPSSPLTVNGVIQSTSGGVKFPDGTIQTTAGPSGTRVLLHTITQAAGTGFVDMTSFTSTYQDYEIVLENVYLSTVVPLELQEYISGTLVTSSYINTGVYSYSSGIGVNGASTTFFPLSDGNDTPTGNPGVSGTISIYNAPSTTLFKHVIASLDGQSSGTGQIGFDSKGYYSGGTGALTGIQIVPASGTITGTVKIYGKN